MKDLEKARDLLVRDGYTCVLYKDGNVYGSRLRGVQPLLELLDGEICLKGFAAADKVVGKATAMLYCLLEVEAVYGQVMSIAAARILQSQGIQAVWGTQVKAIRNRSGDGVCPMEAATRHTEDPQEALLCIRETLARLQKNDYLKL